MRTQQWLTLSLLKIKNEATLGILDLTQGTKPWACSLGVERKHRSPSTASASVILKAQVGGSPPSMRELLSVAALAVIHSASAGLRPTGRQM